MSTTRQHPPGDLGREPDGAASASPDPVERQWRTLSLAQASGIVPTARDFARQALHDWGWLPAATADRRAAAEDVLLVVSELVTNACLHAEGPEELRLGHTPKALRVEVVDRGPGSPRPVRRTVPDVPEATACSSCSVSVSTGASCARPTPRARRSGRSSPLPRDRVRAGPPGTAERPSGRFRRRTPAVPRGLPPHRRTPDGPLFRTRAHPGYAYAVVGDPRPHQVPVWGERAGSARFFRLLPVSLRPHLERPAGPSAAVLARARPCGA